VALNFDNVHKDAPVKVRRWSFSGGFLDTDRLRKIGYGNLVLRKQSHLFLGHGVIVAVLILFMFWSVTANWSNLSGLLGFSPDSSDDPTCYTVITSVTQLPPPPPIDRPEPPPIKAAAPPAPVPVEKPANVGKVKQVKEAEAPPEQTLATQNEIKDAIQHQSALEAGAGTGPFLEDGPVFIPCETMPTFVKQKKPRYPDIARQAGIEGKVIVSVLIAENGKPIKASVVKRIPADCRVFDTVAIDALMKSLYSPGIQNGSPVKVWLTVPMRFKLD